MPPKKKSGNDASKKTVQKKKQQIIEDKTFGLKNKNKSKKIQQFVQSVEKNVMNSGDPAQRKAEEARKKAREEAKLRKKLAKDEQDALFGEALLAVQKKSSTSQTSGKIEAKGRDGDDDDAANKKTTSRAMKMMYQMDAQEMNEKLREDVRGILPHYNLTEPTLQEHCKTNLTLFFYNLIIKTMKPNYVPTLEDEIEMLRSKLVEELKKEGKTGTPINPETFGVWQEKKRKKREEEAAKKVEAELRKKKGGKGLSVLSGRDLYQYKRELFTKIDEGDGKDDIAMTLPTRDERTDDDDDQVNDVTTKVKTELFLNNADEDLDDIMDDDDDEEEKGD